MTRANVGRRDTEGYHALKQPGTRMLTGIRLQLTAKKDLSAEQARFLCSAFGQYLLSKSKDSLAQYLGLRATRRGTHQARKLVGDPRWSANGEISGSGLEQLCFELRDGDPHPADVVAALRAIYRVLKSRGRLSASMRRYLCRALNRYERAQGALSIEQAFGLRRSSAGRAPVPLERRLCIARDVLLACLDGRNLDIAARDVAKQHGLERARALEYWKRHKLEAIYLAQQKLIARVPARGKRRLQWHKSSARLQRRFQWHGSEVKVLRRLLARDHAKIERFLAAAPTNTNS
jgi:hypothetical protein